MKEKTYEEKLNELHKLTGFSTDKLEKHIRNRKIDLVNKDITQYLIDSLLNRETYFMRDPENFYILEDLKRRFGYFSNILIVGSGHCEPISYSLMNPFAKIEAFDISKTSEELWKEGKFTEHQMQKILRDEKFMHFKNKFIKNGDYYELKNKGGHNITSNINFNRANVFDNMFKKMRNYYDLVVCNNVLIYFSRDKKIEAIDTLINKVKVGGILNVNNLSEIDKFSDRIENITKNYYKRIA